MVDALMGLLGGSEAFGAVIKLRYDEPCLAMSVHEPLSPNRMNMAQRGSRGAE